MSLRLLLSESGLILLLPWDGVRGIHWVSAKTVDHCVDVGNWIRVWAMPAIDYEIMYMLILLFRVDLGFRTCSPLV